MTGFDGVCCISYVRFATLVVNLGQHIAGSGLLLQQPSSLHGRRAKNSVPLVVVSCNGTACIMQGLAQSSTVVIFDRPHVAQSSAWQISHNRMTFERE